MSVKEPPFASYPLTHFDSMLSGSGITLGWLAEGLIDEARLESVLRSLVAKWPMLGGRLERQGKSYTVKVPLRPLEPGYLPFVLTSRDSEVAIDKFIELPLPSISDSLPPSLFRDTSAPTEPAFWEKHNLPLTYWHLTFFRHSGLQYTCIGLTFPHVVFDGLGIASVVHALEAESLGRPWPISPVLLRPGDNENELQLALDQTAKTVDCSPKVEYHNMSAVGVWFILGYILWHIWQRVWHKVHNRIIMVPVSVYENLVSDARQAMTADGKEKVRLSTGDVLAAWLLKTIYSADDIHQNRHISLSNQMSLRHVFKVDNYPHNCFMPLPYPIYTTKELINTPIHLLAEQFAIARSSVTLDHAMVAYDRLKQAHAKGKKLVWPVDTRADETLTMTNMSIGRLVNLNWTGLGGGKTVFRYKSLVTASSLPFSNMVTIAGRLDDGRIALEVVLNQRRMKALEKEIASLG